MRKIIINSVSVSLCRWFFFHVKPVFGIRVYTFHNIITICYDYRIALMLPVCYVTCKIMYTQSLIDK